MVLFQILRHRLSFFVFLPKTRGLFLYISHTDDYGGKEVPSILPVLGGKLEYRYSYRFLRQMERFVKHTIKGVVKPVIHTILTGNEKTNKRKKNIRCVVVTDCGCDSHRADRDPD